ncbi:hypothetical protein FACS189413_16550 [Bacteroidia bacterium]|nr:hypothetical protein FACS189413_16550 [Bacteroidia bacterium]
MKKYILFLALTICIATKSYSQHIDAPYEVATWAGFTEAAISYTFDDDCRNQLPANHFLKGNGLVQLIAGNNTNWFKTR